MADVRLTAINPEDSSVVPVACNAGGRLLIEEQGQGPQGEQGPPGPKGEDGDPFSGNFADDVTFDGSATFAESVTSTPSSGSAFYAYNGGTSSENAILISNTSDGSGLKTFLKYDGSATFAGRVYSESIVCSSNRNITGASVCELESLLSGANKGKFVYNNLGQVQIRDGSNTTTAEISSDGSAAFASNKAGFTAEGYLWCTTARGDTVILDATSNGVGVWVEYTPTTRRDEIRDKLDANRGDTGEMPTDTP
jgi:hypothetical protein